MTGKWLAILSLLLSALPGTAQQRGGEKEALARITLIGESDRTARLLTQADQLAAEGKPAEALDVYMQLINDAGDDLVPQGPRHALQTRRLCYQRIAQQPEALRIYRSRVDIQARQWLDLAKSSRDVPGLRRIVDDAFCSRSADQALDLLGDLAFERGEFEEALLYWKMLAAPASRADAKARGKNELVFPDPPGELAAQVRAKQIVAMALGGTPEAAAAELKAFLSLHGQAQGHLCGRDGKYSEILEGLVRNSIDLAPAAGKEVWPTFAGSPERRNQAPRLTGVLARLPQLAGPAWSVRLDTRQNIVEGDESLFAPGRVSSPAKESRGLVFYPVISGDRVFVADSRYITGYDLLTGLRVLEYDLLLYHKNEDVGAPLHLPLSGEVSYTLSISAGKAYARLGSVQPGGGGRRGEEGSASHSFLVCINLHPDLGGRLERWSIASGALDPKEPYFEGAPLVTRGRVYAAQSQIAGGQLRSGIACYDADSGAPRWRRDVCETPGAREGQPGVRQPLLTLAGDNIVYCSHSGAIVALDLLTGRRSWSARYPSRGNKMDNGEPAPRSLSPCLEADGRIFVAPEDYNRIICLDPATGEQLWESAPLETVHLLGVGSGRLIITSTTPVPCIRALDAATGGPRRQWLQPADGSALTTFGRGLLAGTAVFWPTRGKTGDRLHILQQEDGEPIDEGNINSGNLATANGCLVVAGTECLSAYVPEARLLPLRQHQAEEHPASIQALYRLASAETATGQELQALHHFDVAESFLRHRESLPGAPLPELIRLGRLSALLGATDRARRTRRWDEALAYLERAGALDLRPSNRIDCAHRQALVCIEAGDPERAVAVWQGVLADAGLGSYLVPDGGTRLQRAAVVAERNIDLLLAKHGRRIYEPFETKARSLAATSLGGGGREVVCRLRREFPSCPGNGCRHPQAGPG